MQEKDSIQIITDAILNGECSRAIFSSPLEKGITQKIEIRPLTIKNQLHYQITTFQGKKALHQNCLPGSCKNQIFDNYLNSFKQALISLKSVEYQILTNKKGIRTYLKKDKDPLQKSLNVLDHNRKKNYLLDETSLSFLVELGLFSQDGQVKPKKSDKYKQLNRFLEMVEDILPSLNKNETINIIDFGCGKAYLTFALYHYLHTMKGYSIKIIGLDLKNDVVNECQTLAKKLKFEHLSFQVGDISCYETKEKVNMMVTLHACDTATDAALEKAIIWKSDIILSVPCCQHELLTQVENKNLTPLLKHGILKERFSSLVTDAARAQILEIMGYHCQILEFIDMEHTPKNLLIRATIKSKIADNEKLNKKKLMNDYSIFKEELKIYPFLEKRLKKLDLFV